jgi:hypothetical protein
VRFIKNIRFQAFAGFPEYAKQLHDQGLHITLIFDPAIEVDYDPFQRGINSVTVISYNFAHDAA